MRWATPSWSFPSLWSTGTPSSRHTSRSFLCAIRLFSGTILTPYLWISCWASLLDMNLLLLRASTAWSWVFIFMSLKSCHRKPYDCPYIDLKSSEVLTPCYSQWSSCVWSVRFPRWSFDSLSIEVFPSVRFPRLISLPQSFTPSLPRETLNSQSSEVSPSSVHVLRTIGVTEIAAIIF